MSGIQSYIFDKYYYTIKQVKDFIKKHNINPLKDIDVKTNTYRVRILTPNSNNNVYRTVTISEGLKIVYQIPKVIFKAQKK